VFSFRRFSVCSLGTALWMILFCTTPVAAQRQVGPMSEVLEFQRQVTLSGAEHRAVLDVSASTVEALQGWQASNAADRCRLGFKEWVLLPAIAVGVFAAPVAGISWLVADQGKEAAAGAMIGGALYALGGTVAIAVQPYCSSTSPLIYIWTPVAATVGAVIGARR